MPKHEFSLEEQKEGGRTGKKVGPHLKTIIGKIAEMGIENDSDIKSVFDGMEVKPKTLREAMLYVQVKKAIVEKDTPAARLMSESEFGRPKQIVDHTGGTGDSEPVFPITKEEADV